MLSLNHLAVRNNNNSALSNFSRNSTNANSVSAKTELGNRFETFPTTKSSCCFLRIQNCLWIFCKAFEV